MKPTNSKTLRGNPEGVKLKGPGTALSDDIPGQVVETKEPIRVANGERIVSKKQDQFLQEVAREKGFDSVDAMLEAGTGKPVGPTLKYTEGKDDVAPMRHASGGMFDGLKRAIGITPESPELKAYKANAAAERAAAKANAAAERAAAKKPAAPPPTGVYAGRDGAGGNSMARREKEAGLAEAYSGGGLMGVIEANPVKGFNGIPVQGPKYANGGQVGAKKSYAFGGALDALVIKSAAESKAINARKAGPTGGNVAVVGTERTPQASGGSASILGPGGGGGTMGGGGSGGAGGAPAPAPAPAAGFRAPPGAQQQVQTDGDRAQARAEMNANQAKNEARSERARLEAREDKHRAEDRALTLKLRGFRVFSDGGMPMPGKPLPGKPMPGMPMPGKPMPGSSMAGAGSSMAGAGTSMASAGTSMEGMGVPMGKASFSGGGLMGVIEKEVSNYIKGTPSYSGGGIMGEINNGPVGTRGSPPALRNGGEIHADLGGMWENAKRAVTGRPAETVQEKYARKDAAAAARNPTATAPAPTPVAATPAPMGDQNVIDRRMKAAGLRNGGEVCMEGGGLFDTLRSAFSTKAPRFSPTATLGIRGQVGGDLVTGHGGDVPGKGKGDKIPAKYEPGEFVVSNAMLDAKPKLRSELRSLRKDVLADQGMTPAEADAKALRGTGLKAATGYEGRFMPGTRAVMRGFADDADEALQETAASARIGRFARSLGRATLAAPVAIAHDVVRPLLPSGGGSLRDAGYGIANTAATIVTGDGKPRFTPPVARTPVTAEPDFAADAAAKIAAANAADAAATTGTKVNPAKLGDVRNVDNEAGTQDVFTNGAWTTVSTPGAKAARGLRDEQYQQRLKDDFDAATTGPNGWKTRADAADAREKAADDERKFEASLAGLTPQQMVAARQQRLGTTTGLDGERLKADSLLRATQMNNDTQLRTTGMQVDGNMRNSRLASSVAAQKAQMEQFNNDREYAMNVAKFGVEAADKARAASESSAKAMNDRMERMWRTNVDGKDVPDTAKIAEYTQNIQATIPDYISRLLQENTPEALAKAKDLQKRGPAALTDTDHELFRTLQLTKERIEKTRGVLTGSSHKNSASLLGYRQKAGTSLRDGEFQADNGSTSRASDLMYNEPANVILPDWLKTKDDTLTRGLR